MMEGPTINFSGIEKDMSITVNIKNWKKSKIKGNINCPKCNEVMILLYYNIAIYGFCSNCKQYYEADG